MPRHCPHTKGIARIRIAARVFFLALANAALGATAGGVYGVLVGVLRWTLSGEVETIVPFGMYFAGGGAVAGAVAGAFAAPFEMAGAPDPCVTPPRETGATPVPTSVLPKPASRV
jgi:hypothetical protein